MPSPAVLTYIFRNATVYIRNHEAATTYTHQVQALWQADLSVFGSPEETPELAVEASFLARNLGGVVNLPAYVTLHVGGTTGMPCYRDAQLANVVVSDDELITDTSGTEVFSESIPWDPAGPVTRHDVAATLDNPGGAATPFRFALKCPGGQNMEVVDLLITIRAAD